AAVNMPADNGLDKLATFRQEAFDISEEEKMGLVAVKSIDLFRDLIESDANPDKIKQAVAALKSERETIQEGDANKDDPTRDAIYGAYEASELAFAWYGERERKRLQAIADVKKVRNYEEAEVSMDHDDTYSLATVSNVSTKSISSAGSKDVKEEEVEVKMECEEEEEAEPSTSTGKRRQGRGQYHQSAQSKPASPKKTTKRAAAAAKPKSPKKGKK
ncbi:hypothetical protein PENTCL1PPCAC_8007, partial [Pristionchus entomophagus]